jgi:hypothetical protein
MRSDTSRAPLVVAVGYLFAAAAAGCGGWALAPGRPGPVTGSDAAADGGPAGADSGSNAAPDTGADPTPDSGAARDTGAPGVDAGCGGTGAGAGGGGGGSTGAQDGGSGSSQLAVEVFAKDDGLAETNITKPRVMVRNVGNVTLHGFEMRYYFAVGESMTPVIDVYYSPEAQLSVVQDSGNRWYVSASYQHDLAAGEQSESGAGLTYGLHFASWVSWNKSDDASHQGLTGTMAVTSHIDVFTAQHQRIYGDVAP